MMIFFSLYNGRMWSFGNGTVHYSVDIFCFSLNYFFRAEAVRHTLHTWLVLKYYAMVD